VAYEYVCLATSSYCRSPIRHSESGDKALESNEMTGERTGRHVSMCVHVAHCNEKGKDGM
jgi:hypothetical protein